MAECGRLQRGEERITEMEKELIGRGTAETGPFKLSLQALKDFGFLR